MRRKADGLKWKVMAMRAFADSRDPEMFVESKNALLSASIHSDAVTFSQSSASLQERREGVERRLRHVMLDALGVGFRRFARRADSEQEIDDQPVALARALGHRLAGGSEEHAAIGLGDREALALEAGDGLARGRMGDAEVVGDVGHPRFAIGRMQIGDELGVVLEERGGARLPRPVEAPGMVRRRLAFDPVHSGPIGLFLIVRFTPPASARQFAGRSPSPWRLRKNVRRRRTVAEEGHARIAGAGSRSPISSTRAGDRAAAQRFVGADLIAFRRTFYGATMRAVL